MDKWQSLHVRLNRLRMRGVEQSLLQSLWETGDLDIVADLEAASDDQIAALNREWRVACAVKDPLSH